jgi:hypothetical protein
VEQVTMADKRKLKMKVTGRFIELLGQQMYGGPVPAVAELIANAWDADADMVKITLPEDPTAQNAEIVVRDFGNGMTFDELNECYLTIGYEKRKKTGDRTAKKRLVMGRKGIGKLGGFGIAEYIVLQSVKDGHLVEFTLKYSTLRERENLQDYIFSPDKDEPSSEPAGVTVTFRGLKLKKKLNIESFRKSISRRFALNTEAMKIYINSIEISKDNLDFEFRTPSNPIEWTEEKIVNFGDVKYWFGFLKNTIMDTELRGVTVFARDRLAQTTPFVFNLTGGINGQVGLEYLTGQIKADPLDEVDDLISTDRQGVNWNFEKAKVLEEWGQAKVKKLCSEWKKRRDQEKAHKFKHSTEEMFVRISKLPKQEQEDLTLALDRISLIDKISVDEFQVIGNSMIDGVSRESVKKVIRKINTTSDESVEELMSVINEWDIISAVSTAEVVAGKLEIINKFKKYIEERLPEKKGLGRMDMQTFIKNHPWLLGHDYENLTPAEFHHERGVDKWIYDEIIKVDNESPYKRADEREGRRFDLLCIKSDWLIVILELMRPGDDADYDHLIRLNRYVTRIQAAINASGTNPIYKTKHVQGFLIADNLTADESFNTTLGKFQPYIQATPWDLLFQLVFARYKEFFDFLKNKAPEDPRVKGLVE